MSPTRSRVSDSSHGHRRPLLAHYPIRSTSHPRPAGSRPLNSTAGASHSRGDPCWWWRGELSPWSNQAPATTGRRLRLDGAAGEVSCCAGGDEGWRGRIDERLSYRCGDTSRPLVEETIG